MSSLNSYTNPETHLFWLASRALGVTAIILLALSVTTGLLISSRFVREPGAPGWLRVVHEALALTAIVTILAHGLLLVGDSYLHPSVPSIFIPGLIHYRTLYTSIGIVAGWLAAIFTFSFYVRKQIGMKRWRLLHRFTLLAYILSVIHVIGSGTDGKSTWMLALLLLITLPILYLLVVRYFPDERKTTTS